MTANFFLSAFASLSHMGSYHFFVLYINLLTSLVVYNARCSSLVYFVFQGFIHHTNE